MHLLAQDLVNGILAGGILAVVALGFSLVWGIMNIINLAHGAYIMLGAYVTYQLFASFHVDPFLSLPVSFVVLFALGYLIQRYIINWVARAPVLTTFLLTFGLSLLLVNIALLIWTGDTRGVTPPYSGTNFTLAGITIPWVKLYTLGAALAITAAMQIWLTRSKTGRAIRATSMDIGAAQLTGVRVTQIYAIVYGLGAGLAGVAGTLVSLSYSLNPTMGQPFLIKAFVVCVLGGLGSVEGALVGGLTYGIVEAFASQIDFTIGSQHVSGTGLQDAVALIVLLIVLIVRPTGIMGRATA
ncbi:branched-chain amino acid ABC transporter permease [Vulcanimicrobium alpinum]|uniref:Branched-chain amino acid ABC transporter permease n=1 Tax=Vulcanimicrobium alpinum TaxID=3016050 RepID=A0AAN1XWL2_UNVUL|nr:branched-chain amino acid ABC transporter permease [Vulcanimicrobium alpinum]BDE06723.1 branched-chain amino acid ABC transporter permease [Vulcanimicrobium alpinum]